MGDSERSEEQTDVLGRDVLSYESPELDKRVDPRAVAAICFAILPCALQFLCCSSTYGRWPAWVIFSCLVSPFIAVVLGIMARPRPGSAILPGHKLARRARIIGYIELVLMALCFLILPSLGTSHERANRVRCASNLRQIGQGLMLYANDNRGIYPPTLDVLITPANLSPEVFVCDSSNDEPATGPTTQAVLADFAKKGRCSYTYLVAGQPASAFSPDHILAHDNPMNHNTMDHSDYAKIEGMHFLFGDGHVEWLTEDNAQHFTFSTNSKPATTLLGPRPLSPKPVLRTLPDRGPRILHAGFRA